MSNYPDDVDSSTVLPGEDCPEMPDIKPCPFCESDAADADSRPFYSSFWCVFCPSCGACGPIADDELAAINTWNRRVV